MAVDAASKALAGTRATREAFKSATQKDPSGRRRRRRRDRNGDRDEDRAVELGVGDIGYSPDEPVTVSEPSAPSAPRRRPGDIGYSPDEPPLTVVAPTMLKPGDVGYSPDEPALLEPDKEFVPQEWMPPLREHGRYKVKLPTGETGYLSSSQVKALGAIEDPYQKYLQMSNMGLIPPGSEYVPTEEGWSYIPPSVWGGAVRKSWEEGKIRESWEAERLEERYGSEKLDYESELAAYEEAKASLEPFFVPRRVRDGMISHVPPGYGLVAYLRAHPGDAATLYAAGFTGPQVEAALEEAKVKYKGPPREYTVDVPREAPVLGFWKRMERTLTGRGPGERAPDSRLYKYSIPGFFWGSTPRQSMGEAYQQWMQHGSIQETMRAPESRYGLPRVLTGLGPVPVVGSGSALWYRYPTLTEEQRQSAWVSLGTEAVVTAMALGGAFYRPKGMAGQPVPIRTTAQAEIYAKSTGGAFGRAGATTLEDFWGRVTKPTHLWGRLASGEWGFFKLASKPHLLEWFPVRLGKVTPVPTIPGGKPTVKAPGEVVKATEATIKVIKKHPTWSSVYKGELVSQLRLNLYSTKVTPGYIEFLNRLKARAGAPVEVTSIPRGVLGEGKGASIPSWTPRPISAMVQTFRQAPSPIPGVSRVGIPAPIPGLTAPMAGLALVGAFLPILAVLPAASMSMQVTPQMIQQDITAAEELLERGQITQSQYNEIASVAWVAQEQGITQSQYQQKMRTVVASVIPEAQQVTMVPSLVAPAIQQVAVTQQQQQLAPFQQMEQIFPAITAPTAVIPGLTVPWAVSVIPTIPGIPGIPTVPTPPPTTPIPPIIPIIPFLGGFGGVGEGGGGRGMRGGGLLRGPIGGWIAPGMRITAPHPLYRRIVGGTFGAFQRRYGAIKPRSKVTGSLVGSTGRIYKPTYAV